MHPVEETPSHDHVIAVVGGVGVASRRGGRPVSKLLCLVGLHRWHTTVFFWGDRASRCTRDECKALRFGR